MGNPMRRGLLFFSVWMMAACGNSSDGTKKSPTGSFLAPSDLSKPATVKSFTKDEITDKIRAHLSELKVPEIKKKSFTTLVEDTENTCFKDQANAIKVQVAGDTITADVTLDLAECLKNLNTDSSSGSAQVDWPTFTAAVLRLYTTLSCDQDLSAFEGKTPEELQAMEKAPCEGADTFKAKFQMSAHIAGSQTKDGKTSNFDVSILLAAQSESGDVCTFSKADNSYTISDGCARYSMGTSTLTTDGKSETQSEYFKSVAHGIVAAADGDESYYTSGTLDVTLNNWTGTVTYNGVDQAPTYKFTDGTETVEGSLATLAVTLLPPPHSLRHLAPIRF